MPTSHREKKTHGTQGFPFEIYPALDRVESDLVPYHWHPELEIILIEQGEVEITVGDCVYEGRQGDVYFIGVQQLHEIRGGPHGGFHSFVFPADFLQFSRTDLAQSEILAPLAEGSLLFQTELRAGGPVNTAVAGALGEILQACREQKNGYRLFVKASLLRIIALAAGAGLLRAQTAKSDYKSQMLRDIIAYIDEHCTERLQLGDIAAKFNLSPQYFCTFLKDNLGRTLTQHINFLRVERASRLLRETDRPIMEIGLSVGFDNISYFIKRFRIYFGCTPSAYRKNHS